MKILITGSDGFIAKNLIMHLMENNFGDLMLLNKRNISDLDYFLTNADFIFHLAGTNRPKKESEFWDGNVGLTELITQALLDKKLSTPILFSSTIHVDKKNAYGESKLAAEKLIENYSKKSNAKYFIYRLPNIFGKWSKPNYNSFIATFCNNVAKGNRIEINDENTEVTLGYIDDVCFDFVQLLEKDIDSGLRTLNNVYETTVGYVAKTIQRFPNVRKDLVIDSVGNGLKRALYSTYLSYLEPENFSYELKANIDERGVFTEFIKTKNSGQISFFSAGEGVTRGDHYHHTKNEKFLVIQGSAKFMFKNMNNGKKFEKIVDSKKLEVVETIPGWSHNITNIGNGVLLALLWANEIFDPASPDTYKHVLIE